MCRIVSVVVALLVLLPAAASAAGRTPVGAAHPPIAGARAIGPAPAGTRLDVRVTFQPRDAAALRSFVQRVSDPDSAEHGRYLTKGAFAARFGPTDATVARVRTALRRAGLRPGALSPGHLTLRLRTTVAAAERVFRVRIVRVRLADGRIALANRTAPTLPARLAAPLEGVFGLDTQPHHRRAGDDAPGFSRATPRVTASGGPQACTTGAAATSAAHDWTFTDLAQTYGFNQVYAGGGYGQGVTIALIEYEAYASSDIAAFQSCYGLASSVTNVDVDGGPGSADTDVEATMDVETALAMAPQSPILVYQGQGDPTDQQWVDVFDQVADDDSAAVVSTSWGQCEANTDSFTIAHEATVLQQMAAQGQSFLAAAGDNGSEDCQTQSDTGSNALAVDDPGSQVYALSVGGTALHKLADPPTGGPDELVWNDGISGGAGGGGISSQHPMPSWQTGTGVVSAQSSGTPCAAAAGALCRQVPDVSAEAGGEFEYELYFQGAWTRQGGTSAATPLWAGLIASLSSHPQCGGQRFGLLGPKLYAVASDLGSTAFFDITQTNNDAGDQHGGLYPATPGYDMASGLGTPIGGGLLTGLCG